MAFLFELMNETDARKILKWRYEAPYDIYNMDGEDLQYFLDPINVFYRIKNKQGECVPGQLGHVKPALGYGEFLSFQGIPNLPEKSFDIPDLGFDQNIIINILGMGLYHGVECFMLILKSAINTRYAKRRTLPLG